MKILLATDGSEGAKVAARLLGLLRLSGDTRITVLTVAPEITPLGGKAFDRLRPNLLARARTAEIQRAREIAGEARGELIPLGVEVDILVREGRPAEEIAKAAEEAGVDLITLGSRGLTGLKVLLLGSVAEEVLVRATRPVLVARPTGDKLAKVLFATDGSEEAELAGQFLLRLPLPEDVQIICLAVVPPDPPLVGMSMPARAALEQVLEDVRQRQVLLGRELVSSAQRSFEEAGYRASGQSVIGRPANTIVRLAKTNDVDLIVVGSRGLSGLTGLILGTTARYVVRNAPCSVLVGKMKAD